MVSVGKHEFHPRHVLVGQAFQGTVSSYGDKGRGLDGAVRCSEEASSGVGLGGGVKDFKLEERLFGQGGCGASHVGKCK